MLPQIAAEDDGEAGDRVGSCFAAGEVVLGLAVGVGAMGVEGVGGLCIVSLEPVAFLHCGGGLSRGAILVAEVAPELPKTSAVRGSKGHKIDASR